MAFVASPDDCIVAVDRNVAYLRRYRDSSSYRNAFPVVADAAYLPIVKDSIDRIACTELLEHVANYQKVIAEMARACHRGCRYIISVPVARWERLFRILHPHWLSSSGHVNVFSITALAKELQQHGIAITAHEGANSWSCLYWCCHSLAHTRFNDAGLTLNHRWIGDMFLRSERLLRRLRLWNAFNAVGDRFWPKSWVINARKS